MIDTKQRLLDTAERLFGENGYASVSLRQVIAEAEVNIAAVHYHFGSKEGLLDAVLLRKIGPVTKQRMENLDRVLAEAGSKAPCVEKVLEAFLLPTAAVAPTASVSVTMTIDENVGARRRLRNECQTSRRSASHMREGGFSSWFRAGGGVALGVSSITGLRAGAPAHRRAPGCPGRRPTRR